MFSTPARESMLFLPFHNCVTLRDTTALGVRALNLEQGFIRSTLQQRREDSMCKDWWFLSSTLCI